MTLVPAALAQAASDAPALDWKAGETLLSDHVQLTFPAQFTRAGEAYFDHHSPPRWIVFQATQRPPASADSAATAQSPHYAMYIARLIYSRATDDGSGTPSDQAVITGIEPPLRISPEGSANTCAWFPPHVDGFLNRDDILFASTVVPPTSAGASGFQRGTSTYRWDFPPEMKIVRKPLGEVYKLRDELAAKGPIDQDATARLQAALDAQPITPVVPSPFGPDAKPSYAAECSIDPRGHSVMYTCVDPQTGDADLWAYHPASGQHASLVKAKGYDGGSFFSPDGQWICYRSDRSGDNNLQLFVARLAFDDKQHPARVTGVQQEFQVTDQAGVVNWAPFWHPSGRWLIYASSAEGHRNYELFAIDLSRVLEADATGGQLKAQPLPTQRVSHASGFDGLPAFDVSGTRLIFTSQRGGTHSGEQRPTSQVWITNVRSAFD